MSSLEREEAHPMSTDARPRGRDEAGDAENVADRQSLKVKIPADYHTKLHSIKVLTGKTISNAITEALRDYLDEVEDDGQAQTDTGSEAQSEPA